MLSVLKFNVPQTERRTFIGALGKESRLICNVTISNFKTGRTKVKIAIALKVFSTNQLQFGGSCCGEPTIPGEKPNA